MNYQDANGNAIKSADARKWKIFHFLALAFAFLTFEPDQRKRKHKRKVKNTHSRAFGNILFFSTKAAVIFKNKLKKQMAWADVASEVGLQNGKCCDKKGKSCLFRKISRTHKRLGLDLLFLCIRRLRLIRRRPRKRKNNNTNTSTSSTILEYSIALAYCTVLAFALDV